MRGDSGGLSPPSSRKARTVETIAIGSASDVARTIASAGSLGLAPGLALSGLPR